MHQGIKKIRQWGHKSFQKMQGTPHRLGSSNKGWMLACKQMLVLAVTQNNNTPAKRKHATDQHNCCQHENRC